MRTIKRLLWVGKHPAAYNRSLIMALESENHMDIRYIFMPRNLAEEREYAYEKGALSKNTVFLTQTTKDECRKILNEYSQDPQAGIFFYGLYPRILLWWAIRIRNRPCCKLYFSDSNIIEQHKWPRLTRLFYSWLLGVFDYLLIIGSYNALYYRWLFGPQKYSRMNLLDFPLPHDSDEYKNIARAIEQISIVRFLYVGRLPELKNVISLIRAAQILRDKSIRNFHITIAGDGETFTSLIAAIKRNQLESLIELTGGMPSNETKKIYAANHVFVFPSHHDRWAMVINEALSAGLPVIAPAWVGAAADLVVDGYTGRKLLKNTPQAFADAMQEYIQNPQLIIDQSYNAQLHIAKSRKTIHQSLEQLKSIFV